MTLQLHLVTKMEIGCFINAQELCNYYVEDR